MSVHTWLGWVHYRISNKVTLLGRFKFLRIFYADACDSFKNKALNNHMNLTDPDTLYICLWN